MRGVTAAERARPAETAIAAPVVEWLRQNGWEPYQEVQISGGRTVDIVGVCGRLLWAIEVKVTLGLSVIEQATVWTSYAHYVSVATPTRRSRTAGLVREILEWKGIGRIGAECNRSGGVSYVTEVVPARLNRRILPRLRDALREEQKTYAAAGSTGRDAWTPYKATCNELRKLVVAQPGITMREAIRSIRHHYSSESSARSSLAHWLERGKVRGVRLERDGRFLRLYPEAA